MSDWIWAKLKTCGMGSERNTSSSITCGMWLWKQLTKWCTDSTASGAAAWQTTFRVKHHFKGEWEEKTWSFVISCQEFSEPQEIQSHPISPPMCMARHPNPASQKEWADFATLTCWWNRSCEWSYSTPWLFPEHRLHHVNSPVSKSPQNYVHKLFKWLEFAPTTELRVHHLKSWINMKHDTIP